MWCGTSDRFCGDNRESVMLAKVRSKRSSGTQIHFGFAWLEVMRNATKSSNYKNLQVSQFNTDSCAISQTNAREVLWAINFLRESANPFLNGALTKDGMLMGWDSKWNCFNSCRFNNYKASITVRTASRKVCHLFYKQKVDWIRLKRRTVYYLEKPVSI